MCRMSFKLLIPAGLLATLLMLNPTALAVGLGQVEVDTRLNEPLRAEIPLRSVGSLDTDELEVSLASAEEFARVGIDRPGVLTRLTFTVEGGEWGPVVRVTSEEPITEPFLSFLVRVSWPQGRLLREYTVLLDPPVTAPATAPQPRQAPSQAVQREEPADAGVPTPSGPVAGEPEAHQPEADTRPSGGTYGPVASGETLWGIANRARPDDSISVNQMMLALLRTNPDAFFRDNINALRRGAVLRIPDRGDIQRLGATEALAAVRRQNDLWQDYRRNLAEEAPTVVAGGETQERAPVEDASDDEGSRLELVPPREGEAEAGAVAAGPGARAAEADREALREELARTREDLLARREQTDQLDGRVNELEAQVERLQRLLELKNEELAAIQSQADEQGDGETPSEGPDPLAMDEGAPEEAGPGDQAVAEETGAEDAELAGQPGMTEDESDAAPGAASQAQEPVEESATDESEASASAPPPPPSSGGWTDLLLSPVVLGIAGLLLIGVGVALFLHRRGSPQAQSTVQRESLGERMTRREARPAEVTAESPAVAGPEEEFGPPEAGPVDYDEAALRAALEDNPEDTETRLKLIRHYAAAGDREAFIAQAETLYADLADPASPAWLETRELGEDIAPDHALFGGGGDVRSETDEDDEVASAPEAERFGYSPSESEADTRDTGETTETEAGTSDRETGAELPDLDFESPAPEEPAPEEPSAAEPESERPTGLEPAGEEEGFDLSGLETDRDEGSAADSATPESGETASEESFDLGDMADSRESEEQEPLEFDLSDFETEAGSDSEGESEAEDWMTSSGAETEAFEAPGSEPESGEGTAPEVGEETAEPDREAAPGAGGDAVETKLELAEAYMDMSDEEGAREMLEEVLSEGDEGQQKRAREMLDKLS